MNPLLVVSIVIRLAALAWGVAWSIVLIRRLQDWRVVFMTVVLGLAALRDGITLAGTRDAGIISLISGAGEEPGILVSIGLFVTIPILLNMIAKRQRAEESLRESEAKFRALAETAAAAPLQYEGSPAVIGTAFDITERRIAEQALRETQERLQHLLLHSPAIIYSLRLEGKSLAARWISDSITRLTGYTPSEALTEGWWADHLHPDDRARVMEKVPRLFADDRLVMEYRFQHKEGGYLWLNDESVLLRNDSGAPVEAIGSWVDVTERREAEAALRNSEERFRTLVSSMDDIVFTLDRERRYTGVYGSWIERFGLERDDFIGKTASEIVGAEAGRIHEDAFAGALAGERVIYEWSPPNAPRELHFQSCLSPIRDLNGEVVGVVGVGRDTTERRLAEDELRRQKEILQKIFDHAPLMISFAGEDGRIKLVNQEWERTLGWSLEEMRQEGLDILEECYPNPRERQQVLRFITESDGAWTDFKPTVRDGRVIDTSWIRVRLSDGTSIGIEQDITERKRAEETLRRRTAQLAALHEIELEISAESDLTRVLDVVTRRAAELLNATYCCIFTRESEQADLDLVAALDGELIGLRLNEVEALAGQAVLTGEVQTVADYSELQGRFSLFEGKGHGPALAAPLKWQQTVIGAICLSRKRGDEPFTGDDSKFFEQIAAEAAIAIHQTTLFEEVEESRRRLQVLSHRLIDAQEAERKRLARELHDQIGQALTAVQISLQTLRPSLKSAFAAERVEENLALIEDALGQVHDLSLELRPSLLDDLGLVAALRWYVERVASRARLLRCFKADSIETRVSAEIETACFRIAQEALTNVMRHSNASAILVQLKRSDQTLQLTIRDDGSGFTVADALNRTGPEASLGLQGMRERAVAVGGAVEVESAPGRGTEVRASFPLVEKIQCSESRAAPLNRKA
jgi:PAS domain S-box-containing protein